MPSYKIRNGFSYVQRTTNGGEQRFNQGDTVDLPAEIGDNSHCLERIEQLPVEIDVETDPVDLDTDQEPVDAEIIPDHVEEVVSADKPKSTKK